MHGDHDHEDLRMDAHDDTSFCVKGSITHIVLLFLGICFSAGVFALETGAPPDGDLNRDGEVNAVDAGLLSALLAGEPVSLPVRAEAADMDADGALTIVDQLRLRLRAETLATILRVDDDNTTGVADGSAARPFPTVAAAAAAAAFSGVTIKVAAGQYDENIILDTSGKILRLVGGFSGGAAADYARGLAGDFTTRSLDPAVTVLAGASRAAPVLRIDRYSGEPMAVLIDNFRVTGGERGILIDTEFSWPQAENVTIADNLIEDNGDPANPDAEVRGAGIGVAGANVSLLDNVIRRNHGGRGAGIGRVSTPVNLLVRGNRVEDNHCYSDHGGGIALNGTVTLAGNIIRGNRVELGYGWGGGVLLAGDCQAIMTGDVIDGNYAPGIGGGVFVDEGAVATLDHELIVNNRTSQPDKGGAAVYVDGGWDWVNDVPLRSSARLIGCTVANNTSPGANGGNGVTVEYQSAAEIVDCVFWGNGDDFYLRQDGLSLTAAWTLSAEPLPGDGNFSADPLLADLAGGDFHLKSAAGRWDPAASGDAGGWVVDPVTSPAIDRGDPAADFSREQWPNGGRLNLGVYGNTPQASRTPPGKGKGSG